MTATNGVATNGSLAAALGASEVRALLRGEMPPAAGKEILFDVRRHVVHTTRLTRNPACRFSHAIWDAADASTTRSIGDWLPVGSSLSVPGLAFVTSLACGECESREKLTCLEASVSVGCPKCGAARPITGFDLRESIDRDSLGPERLAQPLERLGLRPGDLFAIECDEEVNYFVVPIGSTQKATVVQAGCGNIGSFLAGLLARETERIVLCDPDHYEKGQEQGQDITPADWLRPKAIVQAERLARLRPNLEVVAWPDKVESLPTGYLRGAVVVSALDSVGARLRLAARAWHVASGFVDTAVGDPDSGLARTTVYLPSEEGPCFECSVDSYDGADEPMPCEAK